jgi:hypothetical protein
MPVVIDQTPGSHLRQNSVHVIGVRRMLLQHYSGVCNEEIFFGYPVTVIKYNVIERNVLLQLKKLNCIIFSFFTYGFRTLLPNLSL